MSASCIALFSPSGLNFLWNFHNAWSVLSLCGLWSLRYSWKKFIIMAKTRYLCQKQALNDIHKVLQLVLVWGSRQSCSMNFQWRLGRTLHVPSSATCMLERRRSFQAWDGNKYYKTASAEMSWNLVIAQVKLVCRMWLGSRWELVLQPQGCDSVTCKTGTVCVSPWVSPFLFLQQQLQLQILVPKAQSKHRTSNRREIIPPKSSVSGQCSECALAWCLPDLVSDLCQSWKLQPNYKYHYVLCKRDLMLF